jgi:hypothetical protein
MHKYLSQENEKEQKKKKNPVTPLFAPQNPIGTTMSYSVSSHFSLETHQVDITKRFFQRTFDIAVVPFSLEKQKNPFR